MKKGAAIPATIVAIPSIMKILHLLAEKRGSNIDAYHLHPDWYMLSGPPTRIRDNA